MEKTAKEPHKKSTDPEIASIEESLLNSARSAATTEASQQDSPKPKKKKHSPAVILSIVIALIAFVGLGLYLGNLILNTPPSSNGDSKRPSLVTGSHEQKAAPTEEELRILDAVEAGAAASDPNVLYLPTPLVAQYGDLLIHSPIVPRDLTEVEYHQASYDTSLPLTPLLTIVDAEEVEDNHGTNHIPYEDQPFGDKPLIGEAVSTWRLDSIGDEYTSVDVGALAGTVVYAPVSGTVVKIKTYSLYELIDDYELHIQSPDYPELDIVVLHIDELTVKVGDEVYGGCTRIGKVRNIGDIVDNNLSNFTMPPDPGDHCHVQVNDATREDYPGLEGALDIFNGHGYARPEPPPEAKKEGQQ